jgi:N-acyl-D-amino-acid deacylase
MTSPFRFRMLGPAAAAFLLLWAECASPAEYDIVLRGGTIYDGSGRAPFVGDLAIQDDMVAAVGDLSAARGKTEIRVVGLAVAPGFINMMSWANESLIEDGRSQSDIRRGVTLEVMGEGESMGPLNDRMKQEMLRRQGDIKYPIEWTTLGEYLRCLERRGVSPNVASFIGAATPRVYVIGRDNRPPTAEELKRMQDLVRHAMEEGAVGVAAALVYPPGCFAKTDELIALAQAAASLFDGPFRTGHHHACQPAHHTGSLSHAGLTKQLKLHGFRIGMGVRVRGCLGIASSRSPCLVWPVPEVLQQ